jgi:hypothetical protein
MALVVEPTDAPRALRQAAADALHGEHYALLGEHGAVEVATPAACSESAACLEELAEAHGLPYVLAVATQLLSDGYRLETRLYSAATGDFAAQRSIDCHGCSPEQAAARLHSLSSDTVRQGRKRPLGLLEISSQPSGAEVLVDGRRLGTTPYRRSTGVGEHAIVIHKTGFLDYENFVDVELGRGSALDATLRPDTPPPAPPRNLSRRQ